MFIVVVWIEQYGSWSKGGFASYDEAAAAGADQIYRHAFGDRTDVHLEVRLEVLCP